MLGGYGMKWFTVCQYEPPGNVEGGFEVNVAGQGYGKVKRVKKRSGWWRWWV